ncbi:S-layer homology domain-containing protein [Nodosilinea sp. LEGE 07088]|uniref:S-layer homology domain-containing protein n=1 Tax=Nodosilinea sp. LEGE 07088 TaxID=2777968 RepID=UPI00187F816B|nr:S-layer homology domain-containing protein [Nodosilinea sp. LEGE 07088]MBE9138138.1 S-layer homology domain-containing protein [Nodosilinea sp. LEGE 07088]
MPQPWRRRLLALLGAIAAGTALVAWTSKRPLNREPPLTPAALFHHQASRQPLTVPPQVLPQPLPPHQAWPELPVIKAQPRFTDLSADHWAWPLLIDLAQRNLLAGFPDGSFRPAEPMTRAEFATQVVQLFSLPPDLSQPAPEAHYPDVDSTHWAHVSVQKAVQMKFLSGSPEGKFLPDQAISRIQVITALANGLGLKSSSSPSTVLAFYDDDDEVPPWATQSLLAATEAGLVVSYPMPTLLSPNQPASRAEVAAMLHRTLTYIGRLEEIPFPYVAGQPTPTPNRAD